MSLPINIEKLIEQRSVESVRIEYKSGWDPEPVIHTVCAFANDIDDWGGGYIILGIENDNGMPRLPVRGLNKEEIDGINKDLLQKCNTIEPRYVPVVENTQYGGKEIMIIWVPGGNDRPYSCPISFPDKREKRRSEVGYYIRKMSNSIKANENEIKELFSISSNVPFDDRINMAANIEDLRHPLMSNFLYEVESELYERSKNMSVTDLAGNMRMAAGPKENIRPLNVGLMFFNERPDDFFRYARIEVVDKPDPTGDGMTEKIFTGPLDRQLKDALAFIKNYVIKEKIFKYSDRAESDRFFNYPMGAIEEIITNAVYHKSYQLHDPIIVEFTPEKMEVTSFPGPDRSISDEDLKNCRLVSRNTRNRRIGDLLKELKLAEGRNTGIPRIIREIKKNGSDMPAFETDADRRYLTVSIPIHRAFREKESKEKVRHGTEMTDIKRYKSVKAFRPYRSRSELEEAILKVLERENISKSKLAGKLGYAKITDGMREAISRLMDDGIIEHTIPNNPTDKNQQLRSRL